jgi:CRISPR-associated protein Cas1
MQNLYVLKEDVILKRENKAIKLEGSEIKKIPVSMINGVFLFGGVELTRGARNLLLENNKDIYFFSSRGFFRGVLHTTKLKSNYKNRLLQYKNIDNLDIAKYIIKRKIDTIEIFLDISLNRYKEKLKEASNLNEILGIEGVVSSYFFRKIKEILESFGINEFKKREYRPVKDKVNGLFSFIYYLYYSFLHTIVLNEGFDPYIGFLHRKRGTHMAFVSDLMEFYRVVLTEFVVELLINKKITEDDFNGLYLHYEGRKKFIRYYLELLESINHTQFLEEIKKLIKS